MKKLWIIVMLIVLTAALPRGSAGEDLSNLIFESVITEKHFDVTTIYVEHGANGSFIAPMQQLNFRISAHDMDDYGHTVSLVKNGVVNRRYEDDGYYKVKISADVIMGETLFIEFRFDNVTFLQLQYRAVLDQFSFSDNEDWSWLWEQLHKDRLSGPEVIDIAQSKFEKLNAVLITSGICLVGLGVAYMIVRYSKLISLVHKNHFTKGIFIAAFAAFVIYQFMLVNNFLGREDVTNQEIVGFFMDSYISIIFFLIFLGFYIIGYVLTRIRLKEKIYMFIDMINRHVIADRVVEYRKAGDVYMALQSTSDAIKRWFKGIHWKIKKKDNEGFLEDDMDFKLQYPKAPDEESIVACDGGSDASDTKRWQFFPHFRNKPIDLLLCQGRMEFKMDKEEPVELPKEAKEKIEAEVKDPTKVSEILEVFRRHGKKPVVKEFIVEVDPCNAHGKYSDYEYLSRAGAYKELEAAYREEIRDHLKTELNTEMEATSLAKEMHDASEKALRDLDERIQKKRVKKETIIKKEGE